MKFQVLYRRKKFVVDWNRPRTCQACGNDSGKNGCHCHHYKYEFKTEEVRKNHDLLKKNTVWLCFPCHRIADAIRIVDSNPTKVKAIRKAIG